MLTIIVGTFNNNHELFEANKLPQQQISEIRDIVETKENRIIYTCSDFVIRELNIMIMLGSSQRQRSLFEEEFSDIPSLDKKDIVVFVAKKLGYSYDSDLEFYQPEITDTGFEVEFLDNVIHEQNMRSQTIYSRYFLNE